MSTFLISSASSTVFPFSHSVANEDEAMTIKNTVIVKELNLPPVKIHCSVLAEDAIKAAITDWRKRKGDDVGVEAPAKQEAEPAKSKEA